MSLPQLVDTHCHIQEASADSGGDDHVRNRWLKGGFTDPARLIEEAVDAGVTKLMVVGCSLRDSQTAVRLAQQDERCSASIGIHPHESGVHLDEASMKEFAQLATQPRVKAIGEFGLDYYYNHSDKRDQLKLLEFQLDLAQKHNLPCIFHVREAFDDFWSVYDQYKGVRGVIHSFSSNVQDLENVLARGLYVGLNGIMTFTKNPEQIQAAKRVPLQKLLLETDAPYLTPAPERSIICQPKHVRVTAEFLAGIRGESLDTLAYQTTQNACTLFGLK